MSGTIDALDLRPHSVYRCYDATGALLYVGCTRDVETRMALHEALSSQSEASRFLRRHMARYESLEYPTKAAAREAEREAIRTGLPLLNKQHNPRYRKGPNMRYLAQESA